jgi:hypothetical protein
MANGWTLERRAHQSEQIRRWRPWLKSSGPRTRAGKARIARNAFKGGTRATLRLLAKALRSESFAEQQDRLIRGQVEPGSFTNLAEDQIKVVPVLAAISLSG